MIIIQQIRTTWTTKSRAAPGSITRNAVPKSVVVEPEECTFLFEGYIFEESDSFEQKRALRMKKDLIPYQVGNLILNYQNDELNVGFQWEYSIEKLFNARELKAKYHTGKIEEEVYKFIGWGVGFPYRHEIKSAFHLTSGMFDRLIINGLYRKRGAPTRYSQDIYNIAVFEVPHQDLFTSREPDRVVDLRDALDNPSLLGS